MKKTLLILAAILLLPGGMVLAARDGGDGGGGRDNGGGGDRGGGGTWSGGSSTANSGGTDSVVSHSGISTHNSNSSDRVSNSHHSFSNGSRFNGPRSSIRSSNYRNRGNNSFGNGSQRHFNASNRNGSSSSGVNHYSRYSGAQSRFTAGTQRVPANLRTMGINKIPFSKLSAQMPGNLGKHPSLGFQKTGPGGSAHHASVVSPKSNRAFVQNHMATFANNRGFRSQARNFNQSENVRGRYYWHNWNGQRYCHYYDGFYNWYGWYGDGSCFWSCYYGNDWWWYDTGFDRWCYWNDGYWWWQNPTNVNITYLYNNGDYVPADQPNNDALNDDSTQGQNNDDDQTSSANQDQASQGGEIVFQSKNKNRTVKVMGDESDAFLYDTGSKSFKPVFLDTGVTMVRFTGSGKDLKILLTLENGSVEAFKANGKPAKGAPVPKPTVVQ